MTKNKLLIDFPSDCTIWAISSTYEDYRLCWFLNQELKWSLKREEDVELFNAKTKELIHFSCYQYRNPVDKYTLEILQNKRNGYFLVPELKYADFLFLLQGEDDYFDEQSFSVMIHQISGIQSIQPVDLQRLKSKNNLLIRHLYEPEKKDKNYSYDRSIYE